MRQHNIDKETRVEIGEFCCALRFADADFAVWAREYFSPGFISPKKPDIIIDINVISPPGRISLSDSLLASKSVKGNKFNFCQGLIEGSLDVKHKHCIVTAHDTLFYEMSLRVFDQFLYIMYYTLLKEKYLQQIPNNFLVHASGVIRAGYGYVFTGPGGSGKSTIADLSAEYSVLNDEVVIIGKRNGRFRVKSAPFNGEYKTKQNRQAPLRAIFYIKHAKKNGLKKLSKLESIKRLLQEVIKCTPLLAQDSGSSLSEMLDFCSLVVEEVPFYELEFFPDNRFWKYISDNLNGQP